MSANAPIPAELADRIDSHLWDAAVFNTAHRGETLPGNLQGRVKFDAGGAVQTYIRVDSSVNTVSELLGKFNVRVEESNQDMRINPGLDPAGAA